jgi:hypothetical protein
MAVRVQQRFSVAHDPDVTLPEHEIAATQIGEVAPGSSARRALPACMSVSRGASIPAACSEICTRPEQSRPAHVLPPHR